jgi:uncharacterized protein YcbK (DUF882 family)
MSKIDIDQNKRNFIKLAGTLGLGAAVCPTFSLMMPESAMAAPMVPLRLANPHTGERYEVELFSGQDWNANALLVCNWMLRDWRQKQTVTCDPGLFAALYVAQRYFNADGFINVNSGYRSPETNAFLRSRSLARTGRATAETPAVNSQHIKAKAVDFSVPGVKPMDVALFVKSKLQSRTVIGGVGSYDTFTHMDTGSVRQWGRGL